MMRFVGAGFVAAGAALMLGLAGCAAPAGQAAAGPQAAPPAAPPSAPTSAPPSAQPAVPTPPPAAFSPQDIQTALGKVDSAMALDGNVIGHDDILKSIPQSVQALRQLKVQPAECAGFAQVDYSKAVANAALGAIVAHPTEPTKSVAVSVISYVSSDLAPQESVAQDQADLARCPAYTMQLGGISLRGTMKAVDVAVPGVEAIGVVTDIEAPNVSQRTVMVRATRGPLRIAVIVGAGGMTEAAAVQRAQDIAAVTVVALDGGPSVSLTAPPSRAGSNAGSSA